MEKYAKLVDSIQYNSQKVCLPKLNIFLLSKADLAKTQQRFSNVMTLMLGNSYTESHVLTNFA